MKYLLTIILVFAFSACGDEERTDKRTPTTPSPKTNSKDASEGSNSGDLFAVRDAHKSKHGHFYVKVDWPKGQKLKAKKSLKVQLTFATKGLSAPAKVEIQKFDPQMPSMGHGTSTEDQVFTLHDGSEFIYAVSGIFFIMGGEWEIYVTATVDGRKDMVTIPVYIK